MTYGRQRSFPAGWTGPWNTLRIHPATGIELNSQFSDLQLCFQKPTPSFELPENETTCPKVPQLKPELAVAWQSKEQSWAGEQSPARLRAQRVLPVVHPALTHRASRLPLCRETLPAAPAALPFFCCLPGAWPRPARTHPPSPLLPRCQDTAPRQDRRDRSAAKVRGRNDPTLPHPRLESRNNSKTGERQSSKQHNTAPAHGSRPALGLGEKELTAGAEQGRVSWSLRQQRLPCCTTWLGLLSSQLT